MFTGLGIKGRLALAIGLTALIPVSMAIVLARSMVQQSSERFFVPELRQHLEQSLGVYRELARTTKESMRHQASALAANVELRAAVVSKDAEALRRALREIQKANPNVVSLTVLDQDDQRLAFVDRGRPVDEALENQLLVVRELDAHAERSLQVLFATPSSRFKEFAAMGEFVDAYGKLEARRNADERTYVMAFSALLGVTIIAAIAVGILLARSVTGRILRLAAATRQVGAGDLSVRVEDEQPDEIGDLGRAFNHMLTEVAVSRSRIEYLSRLASWQEMARRLAHEIKNPLTPIQLAVQEVHQRLDNLPAEQKVLLDTTLDIVQAEVQTLRRLVTEFSEFARLPESKTEPSDLYGFLRELEQETQLNNYVEELGQLESGRDAKLQFDVPQETAPVMLDLHMMRRVLINLLQNALQACASQTVPTVRVVARRLLGGYEVCVDDNGPGVPEDMRDRVFEPYMTTKDAGTGLGLAIVKKVAIDHGGDIQMLASPLGGARLRLTIPSSA